MHIEVRYFLVSLVHIMAANLTSEAANLFTKVEKCIPKTSIVQELVGLKAQSCLLRCGRSIKCDQAALKNDTCFHLAKETTRNSDDNSVEKVRLTVLQEHSLWGKHYIEFI